VFCNVIEGRMVEMCTTRSDTAKIYRALILYAMADKSTVVHRNPREILDEYIQGCCRGVFFCSRQLPRRYINEGNSKKLKISASVLRHERDVFCSLLPGKSKVTFYAC
jgi:hypothetical protein